MRDLGEPAQLDHFRVNKNELQLIRAFRVQPAHDDRIHAHAFSRPRRTGNQHVRHARQVSHQRLTRSVFAQEHRQHHPLSVSAAHQFLESYALFVEIWDLDPDRGLARHVGDQTDVVRAERTGQIAGHGLDLRHFRARHQLHRVQRDGRARFDPHHFAVNVIRLKRVLKLLSLLADERLHLG